MLQLSPESRAHEALSGRSSALSPPPPGDPPQHGVVVAAGNRRPGGAGRGDLQAVGMFGAALAVDVPAAVPGLLEILDQLDKEVALVGGRLYLAKDSRQSALMFAKSYKNLKVCSKVFKELDPYGKMHSTLRMRLIG